MGIVYQGKIKSRLWNARAEDISKGPLLWAGDWGCGAPACGPGLTGFLGCSGQATREPQAHEGDSCREGKQATAYSY